MTFWAFTSQQAVGVLDEFLHHKTARYENNTTVHFDLSHWFTHSQRSLVTCNFVAPGTSFSPSPSSFPELSAVEYLVVEMPGSVQPFLHHCHHPPPSPSPGREGHHLAGGLSAQLFTNSKVDSKCLSWSSHFFVDKGASKKTSSFPRHFAGKGNNNLHTYTRWTGISPLKFRSGMAISFKYQTTTLTTIKSKIIGGAFRHIPPFLFEKFLWFK